MSAGPRRLLPPIGRPAWLALGINALSCLGSGLTMPFLLIYLHAVRGISMPATGFILAAIGVAGIVSTPLSGPLVDRIGALRAFAVGLVLGSLGMAGFVLGTTPARALAAAILYGVASGLMWNGFATLLAQLVSPEERSAVFALRYTTANVAFGAGSLITGIVAVSQRPGPFVIILLADAASYLLFAAALKVLAASLKVPMPQGDDGRSASRPYGAVLRDRALLIALGVNSLLTVFALAQTNTVYPAFVAGPGGGDTRVVGIAFALNIVVLLLVQLPVIRLVRGRSRLRTAALAAIFFAAAWLVVVMPAATGLTGPARTTLLVASLGVFAIGEALLSPTLPAVVNELAPERLRGRYNAVFNLSTQIGPVLAPALTGLALGYGAAEPYLYGLAAVCMGIGALTVALRRLVPAAADLGVAADREVDAAEPGSPVTT